MIARLHRNSSPPNHALAMMGIALRQHYFPKKKKGFTMADTTNSELRKIRSEEMGVLLRNVGAAIQAILVGLVLWVGNSILDVQQDIATLKERNANQADILESMSARLDSNAVLAYTARDAEKDLAQIETKLNSQEKRISVLENALNNRFQIKE